MAAESSLDKRIKEHALRLGAYHQKNHGNEFQRDVPDHTLVYKGRHISLEAKAPTGKLSPGQARQLRKLQKAGAIAEVCYDANLVDSIIKTIDSGEVWANGKY